MASARETLLEAIRAFEDDCGDDPAYRDIKANLVHLERDIRAVPSDPAGPEMSPAERAMREKKGDDYEGRPRNFDDVADRHAERAGRESASGDTTTPSDSTPPGGERDMPDPADRSG